MKIVLYICIGIVVCFGLLMLIDNKEPVYDGDLTRPESFFSGASKSRSESENQLFQANAFLCEFKNGVKLPESASEVFFNLVIRKTSNPLGKSDNPLKVLGPTTQEIDIIIMAEMNIDDFEELVGQLELEQNEDLFTFWKDAFDIKKFMSKSRKKPVPDLWEDIYAADSNTYYGQCPELQIKIAAHYKNGIGCIAGNNKCFANLSKGKFYIKKRGIEDRSTFGIDDGTEQSRETK